MVKQKEQEIHPAGHLKIYETELQLSALWKSNNLLEVVWNTGYRKKKVRNDIRRKHRSYLEINFVCFRI